MGSELDIQRIAEELIARLQKRSAVHANWAEQAKYMAEGAKELHDAICRAAKELEAIPDGDGDAD